MAINDKFYSTVNLLMSKGFGVDDLSIVDYRSFIEAGKKISDLADPTAFYNAFCAALANKIQLSLNNIRTYEAAYHRMRKGTLTAGGVVEMITHGFYDTQVAAFADLVEGTSVDQWKIAKHDAETELNVTYFVTSNAYSIPVTIQYIELEGAFKSPEEMERFINAKITAAVNSDEFAAEMGRLGLMANLIAELTAKGTTPIVSNQLGTHYKLLTLYKNEVDSSSTLTPEEALQDARFLQYAVGVINRVSKKMKKPSVLLNRAGMKVFTPEENRAAYIQTDFESGVITQLRPDAYHDDLLMLPKDYESVPYWQSEGKPFIVRYDSNKLYNADGSVSQETGAEPAPVDSPPVCALIADDWALSEFVEHSRVISTPMNAKGEYINTFINKQLKYCDNHAANTIVFSLS